MGDLRLVIVVARHGDRTPLRAYSFPTDPHKEVSYHPYGDAELTNHGKLRMYKVGQALRNRYDTFLGTYYHPEQVKVVTTDVNRSKTTAMLITAGLYPPKEEQKWHDTLNWQPIPLSYTQDTHKMLFGTSFGHGRWRILEMEDIMTKIARPVLKQYKETLDYLEEHSGLSPFGIFESYLVAITLNTQEALGLELPEWTKSIYPERVDKIASYLYLCESGSPELRKKVSGALCEEIIKDCEQVINKKTETKFVLYSGHETTIAFLLIALGIFENNIPPFGAHVIFELREIDGEYLIQVFYQDFQQEEPKLMTLPELGNKCIFNSFKSELDKIL